MAANPTRNIVAQRLARWNAQHPNHAIDLRALDAVGGQEGYSGRIGDNGHAFGPFQLNDAGGVLAGRFPGQTPQQKQQWASSPAGVDFALSRIAGVAGGQQGPAAVRSIVSKFERPADIPGEISRALASYGTGGAGAGPLQPAPAAASMTAAAPVNPLPQLLHAISGSGGDYTNFYGQLGKTLQQQRATQAPGIPTTGQLGAATQPLPKGIGGIAKTALTQIGIPYQWGGAAKLGGRTDCSGLLQASAKANGVNIGRTTYEQYHQGTPVALDKLKPGDAVFSHPDSRGPGHVAIYIGNGQVVQDPHTGASVSISQLDRAGIVGARRYG